MAYWDDWDEERKATALKAMGYLEEHLPDAYAKSRDATIAALQGSVEDFKQSALQEQRERIARTNAMIRWNAEQQNKLRPEEQQIKFATPVPFSQAEYGMTKDAFDLRTYQAIENMKAQEDEGIDSENAKFWSLRDQMGAEAFDQRLEMMDYLYRTYLMPYEGSGIVWDMMKSDFSASELERMLQQAYPKLFDAAVNTDLIKPVLEYNNVDTSDPTQVAKAQMALSTFNGLYKPDLGDTLTPEQAPEITRDKYGNIRSAASMWDIDESAEAEDAFKWLWHALTDDSKEASEVTYEDWLKDFNITEVSIGKETEWRYGKEAQEKLVNEAIAEERMTELQGQTLLANPDDQPILKKIALSENLAMWQDPSEGVTKAQYNYSHNREMLKDLAILMIPLPKVGLVGKYSARIATLVKKMKEVEWAGTVFRQAGRAEALAQSIGRATAVIGKGMIKLEPVMSVLEEMRGGYQGNLPVTMEMFLNSDERIYMDEMAATAEHYAELDWDDNQVTHDERVTAIKLDRDSLYQKVVDHDKYVSSLTDSSDVVAAQEELQEMGFGLDLEADGVWDREWRRALMLSATAARRENVALQLDLISNGYARKDWKIDGDMSSDEWKMALANAEKVAADRREFMENHPKWGLFFETTGLSSFTSMLEFGTAWHRMWEHGVAHGIIHLPAQVGISVGEGFTGVIAAWELEMRMGNDPIYQQSLKKIADYVKENADSTKLENSPFSMTDVQLGNASDKALVEWAVHKGWLRADSTAQELYREYKNETNRLLDPTLYRGDIVSAIGNMFGVDNRKIVNWQEDHPDLAHWTNIALMVSMGYFVPKGFKAGKNALKMSRAVDKTIEGFESTRMQSVLNKVFRLMNQRGLGDAVRVLQGTAAGKYLAPLYRAMRGSREEWLDHADMKAKVQDVHNVLRKAAEDGLFDAKSYEAIGQLLKEHLGKLTEKELTKLAKKLDPAKSSLDMAEMRKEYAAEKTNTKAAEARAEKWKTDAITEATRRVEEMIEDGSLRNKGGSKPQGKVKTNHINNLARQIELEKLRAHSKNVRELSTQEGIEFTALRNELIELQVNRGKIFGNLRELSKQEFMDAMKEAWVKDKADIAPHLYDPVRVKPANAMSVAITRRISRIQGDGWRVFLTHMVKWAYHAPQKEGTVHAVNSANWVFDSALHVSGDMAFASRMRTRFALAEKASEFNAIAQDIAAMANKRYNLSKAKQNYIDRMAKKLQGKAEATPEQALAPNPQTGKAEAQFSLVEKGKAVTEQAIPDTVYQAETMKFYREVLTAPLRTEHYKGLVKGLVHMYNAERAVLRGINSINAPLRRLTVAAGFGSLFVKHAMTDTLRTVIDEGATAVFMRNKYARAVDSALSECTPMVRDQIVMSRRLSKESEYMYNMGHEGRTWHIARVFEDLPLENTKEARRVVADRLSKEKLIKRAEALRRMAQGEILRVWDQAALEPMKGSYNVAKGADVQVGPGVTFGRPESTIRVWMSPKEYFKLDKKRIKADYRARKEKVPEDFEATYQDHWFYEPSLEKVKKRIDAGESLDATWFEIEEAGGVGKIISQEGRHRALAAEQAGIKSIPVDIYLREGKVWSDYPDLLKKLKIKTVKEPVNRGINYEAGRRAVSEYFDTAEGIQFLKDGRWYKMAKEAEGLGTSEWKGKSQHEIAKELFLDRVVENVWEKFTETRVAGHTFDRVRQMSRGGEPLSTETLAAALKENYIEYGENPMLSLEVEFGPNWQKAFDPGWYVGKAMYMNKWNRGAVWDHAFDANFRRMLKEGSSADQAARTAATIAEMYTSRVHFDLSNMLAVEAKYRGLVWFATKHRLYSKYLFRMGVTRAPYAAAALEIGEWLQERQVDQGYDEYDKSKLMFSIGGRVFSISIAPMFWLSEYAEESATAQWGAMMGAKAVNGIAQLAGKDTGILPVYEPDFDLSATRMDTFLRTCGQVINFTKVDLSDPESLIEHMNTLPPEQRRSWNRAINKQMALAIYNGEDIDVMEAFERSKLGALASEFWRSFKVIPLNVEDQENWTPIQNMVDAYYKLKTDEDRRKYLSENKALRYALHLYDDPVQEYAINKAFVQIDEAAAIAQRKLEMALDDNSIFDRNVMDNILNEYDLAWDDLMTPGANGYSEHFAEFINTTMNGDVRNHLTILFPLMDADALYSAGAVPSDARKEEIELHYDGLFMSTLAENNLLDEQGRPKTSSPYYKALKLENEAALKAELRETGYDMSYDYQSVARFLRYGGETNQYRVDKFLDMVHNDQYRTAIQRGTTRGKAVRSNPWLLSMTTDEKAMLGINSNPSSMEVWKIWSEQWQIMSDTLRAAGISPTSRSGKASWDSFDQWSQELARLNPDWGYEYNLSNMPLFQRLQEMGLGQETDDMPISIQTEGAGWKEFLSIMGELNSDMGTLGFKTLQGQQAKELSDEYLERIKRLAQEYPLWWKAFNRTFVLSDFGFYWDQSGAYSSLWPGEYNEEQYAADEQEGW